MKTMIYNTREDMFMDKPITIKSVVYFDKNREVDIKATEIEFLRNLEQFIIEWSNDEKRTIKKYFKALDKRMHKGGDVRRWCSFRNYIRGRSWSRWNSNC